MKAIETRYAGCRFRSRLEARWAVFFDTMGIGWEYEPQGFMIDNRPYLPDFLLDCGTWVEVKGDPARLDKQLMVRAANQLPQGPVKYEEGPRLMILGPIPRNPLPGSGEFGQTPDALWIGLDTTYGDPFDCVNEYGFSRYSKNSRPWSDSDHFRFNDDWLKPRWSYGEEYDPRGYDAARQARFEHGENG